MGRGRSSTNYNDAEKQLLLRAVAAVKPRRASCWHAIETYYNSHRDTESRVVVRDAHSLKRKFKTMAATRPPRNAEFEDPYLARARDLMRQMKARAAAVENGGEEEEEDEAEDHEYGQDAQEHATTASATTATMATLDDNRRLPTLAPLLPVVPPTTANPRTNTASPPVSVATVAPTSAVGTLSMVASSGMVGADLAQVLLMMREENAVREAARRAEREEMVAREARLREDERELRRQERDEAVAREERYWREMAEQRRQDREEARARHEQMMMLLTALLKPQENTRTNTNR